MGPVDMPGGQSSPPPPPPPPPPPTTSTSSLSSLSSSAKTILCRISVDHWQRVVIRDDDDMEATPVGDDSGGDDDDDDRLDEELVYIPLCQYVAIDYQLALSYIRCCSPPVKYWSKDMVISAPNAYIDLSLLYGLPRDVYTYLGLVGRSIKPGSSHTGFFDKQVQKSEVALGVDHLCRKWQERRGIFVDEAIANTRMSETPKLHWLHEVHSPPAQSPDLGQATDIVSDKSIMPAYNVIEASRKPHTRARDGESSTNAAVDPIHKKDVFDSAPPLLLTNLRALAPFDLAALFGTALDRPGFRLYNVLVATLYHPSVHPAFFAAGSNDPSILIAAVNEAFWQRYEQHYRTADPTLPTEKRHASKSLESPSKHSKPASDSRKRARYSSSRSLTADTREQVSGPA